MPIASRLSPSPNLVFKRIRKLFDKSFSFDEHSLPLLENYFYLEGVVTNDSGVPVAGTLVSVSINGTPYLTVTTLPNGSFRFKVPTSWEDTIRIEMTSAYGDDIFYLNFYDILVIAWIYAEQYLNILQYLAQSKQDTYSGPKVGDVIQPLFLSDKNQYKTLERTLKRRFPSWPFTFLSYGSPEYENLKNLRFWHWYSTFHVALQAIKDAVGADLVLLIPYDEYRLFKGEVSISCVLPHPTRDITVSTSYQRVARRIGFYQEDIVNVPTINGDHYVIANLQNLSYEIESNSVPFQNVNLTRTDLFKVLQGDYAEFEGWTYAVPSYNVYRPQIINQIEPSWDPGGNLDEAGFSELVTDEIQLRVARYWNDYNYDVDILATKLILGAVRLEGAPANPDITDIWTYADLVGYQKIDSLDLAADGELYLFKAGGWTEDQVESLGKAIESGLILSRWFYTMFNIDPLGSVLGDTSYGYLDRKWGGILKGFVNWRNL